MHAQPSFMQPTTCLSIDVSRVSIDCFTRVFSEPNLDLSYATQHLMFDELAAGILDDREVDRLEVLASQNEDINLLLEAFSPLGDEFKEQLTELTLDSWTL